MSLETAMEKLTEATNRQSDLLEKMMAAKGGPAAAEGGTTRRRSTTKDADKTDSAKSDTKADEKPADKPPAEKDGDKADDEDAIYKLVRSFLDYGEDDDPEAEDERDRRSAFVKKMLKYFDVEKARDIAPKNATKVRRWVRLFKDGEKVDFDND